MPQLPEILHRLDAALDDLVRALESGRADAVLSAEPPLAAAVAELSAIDLRAWPIDEAARARLRPVVLALRAHVIGATTMGAASAGLLSVIVGREGYGRTGRQV